MRVLPEREAMVIDLTHVPAQVPCEMEKKGPRRDPLHALRRDPRVRRLEHVGRKRRQDRRDLVTTPLDSTDELTGRHVPIGELGRPVAYISRAAEARPDVMPKISDDVERERPGRVLLTAHDPPHARIVAVGPQLGRQPVELPREELRQIRAQAAHDTNQLELETGTFTASCGIRLDDPSAS